jgi:RNA polymerase sigma factor (TIGR02999 family)
MRRILIDHARRKKRLKRTVPSPPSVRDREMPLVAADPLDVLELDEALTLFAAQYPQKAELVKLRYFAGLSLDEAASVLGISRATANRHWAFAKAWLFRELYDNDESQAKDDATSFRAP